MLTLFALPKPFEGHIGVIQRNAIESWTRLEPRPEIILLGDEAGTAQVAQAMGLRHAPQIARNEYGTPLVGDLFRQAQALATGELLCYVNADIMLMSDFSEAAAPAAAQTRPFLMAGRRWTVDLPYLWDFGPGWEANLRAYVGQQGLLDPPWSIDYFLFPTGFWKDIPPFALGRFFWDNWLLSQARRQNALLIDASSVVMAVHQSHGYSHQATSTQNLHSGPEALRNLELAGGNHRLYGLSLATHLLTGQGLRRRRPGRWMIEHAQLLWNHHSRETYQAVKRLPERSLLFLPLTVAIVAVARASGPPRRRLGRALVAWRERKNKS